MTGSARNPNEPIVAIALMWSRDDAAGVDLVQVMRDLWISSSRRVRGEDSPITQHFLLPWGGAIGRVAQDATPLARRGARWVTHPFVTWEDPADDDANIVWVRDDLSANLSANAPFTTGGVYLNFIGDEGENRIRAAYGAAKLDRLAAIKAEYDPGNVFAGNQNSRPKVSA